VFGLFDEKPKTKVCKAMQGIVEEGKEVMEEDMEPDVMDAALIAAAQRAEHYENRGLRHANARTPALWARMRPPASCSRSSTRKAQPTRSSRSSPSRSMSRR
jgi:hypothetical protein